jgi:3-oxoacyl-[acyl-carrier protein] reductase
MGSAVVARLLADGLEVVATDISGRRLQELSDAQEGQASSRLTTVRADVTDPEGCHELVTEASKPGEIDVLVNVAGGYRGRLLEDAVELSPERVQSAFDLSLRSAMTMTQLCAPSMLARGWGRIVNVASVAMNGSPGQADYAAMKAGIVGYTRSCAMELAPDVTVNAVVPGVIDTLVVERMDEELYRAYMDRIPMRRPGSPREVAGAISFLASDDASYVTGEDLYVAGGFRSW